MHMYSYAFQHLLYFVHGQGEQTKKVENKTYNKETGRVSYLIVRPANYDEDDKTLPPYEKLNS